MSAGARPVRRAQKGSAAARAAAEAVSGIGPMAVSFELALHARNRSPSTIKSYLEAVRIFEAFLVEQGMPTTVGRITRVATCSTVPTSSPQEGERGTPWSGGGAAERGSRRAREPWP